MVKAIQDMSALVDNPEYEELDLPVAEDEIEQEIDDFAVDPGEGVEEEPDDDNDSVDDYDLDRPFRDTRDVIDEVEEREVQLEQECKSFGKSRGRCARFVTLKLIINEWSLF